MIAILLTVWALSVQGGISVISNNIARFLTICNGEYNNLAQHQADNKSHDYIQMRLIPLTTPAMPVRIAVFAEWSYNGAVLHMQLCDLTEDSNGVISLALYTFADTSKYKAGEYKVADISKLKPENLKRLSSCTAKFEPAGPGLYVMTWPDSRHFVNGKPDMYSGLATCNELKIIIPRTATEVSSNIHYSLIHKGERFTVPGAPANFVSPCK